MREESIIKKTSEDQPKTGSGIISGEIDAVIDPEYDFTRKVNIEDLQATPDTQQKETENPKKSVEDWFDFTKKQGFSEIPKTIEEEIKAGSPSTEEMNIKGFIAELFKIGSTAPEHLKLIRQLDEVANPNR